VGESLSVPKSGHVDKWLVALKLIFIWNTAAYQALMETMTAHRAAVFVGKSPHLLKADYF
jgi:hypothetical protein